MDASWAWFNLSDNWTPVWRGENGACVINRLELIDKINYHIISKIVVCTLHSWLLPINFTFKFCYHQQVIFFNANFSWWLNAMETISASLALCYRNQSVTGGFPSQRASSEDLWCVLYCQSDHVEQSVMMLVNGDAIVKSNWMTHHWRKKQPFFFFFLSWETIYCSY